MVRERPLELTSSLWDLWEDAWSSGQFIITLTALGTVKYDEACCIKNLCNLRFDVGSGMATIRDPNPIKLGEFHTVELFRNHTQGYIIVDGGEPINGSSQVSVK